MLGGMARAIAILVAVLLAVIVALVVPFPIPPDRVLSLEPSPDGELVAVFSWRPAGVVGFFTEENPWVYVTIRDAESYEVVERHRVWGDTPDDAYVRLGEHAPWHHR